MGKKNKAPKGTPGMGNFDQYSAMFAKRLSNAASPHDSRPNRERTRNDARRAAIKNSDW